MNAIPLALTTWALLIFLALVMWRQLLAPLSPRALVLTTDFPLVSQYGARRSAEGPGGFTLYLCNFGEQAETVQDLMLRTQRHDRRRLGEIQIDARDIPLSINPQQPIRLRMLAIVPIACPWAAIGEDFAGIEAELDDGSVLRLPHSEVQRIKSIARLLPHRHAPAFSIG
jgi:hypothetical protein